MQGVDAWAAQARLILLFFTIGSKGDYDEWAQIVGNEAYS
jgi:hypothetical protein